MNNSAIFDLENKMWKAAQNRKPEEFLTLVSTDAVMVCSGYRCTGMEYTTNTRGAIMG